MAVSNLTRIPDSGIFAYVDPKLDVLNPSMAEKLIKLVDSRLEQDHFVILDLKDVGLMTNVAARMLCKAISNRPIHVEGTNDAVESSLNWASDYLYRRGELD